MVLHLDKNNITCLFLWLLLSVLKVCSKIIKVHYFNEIHDKNMTKTMKPVPRKNFMKVGSCIDNSSISLLKNVFTFLFIFVCHMIKCWSFSLHCLSMMPRVVYTKSQAFYPDRDWLRGLCYNCSALITAIILSFLQDVLKWLYPKLNSSGHVCIW